MHFLTFGREEEDKKEEEGKKEYVEAELQENK